MVNPPVPATIDKALDFLDETGVVYVMDAQRPRVYEAIVSDVADPEDRGVYKFTYDDTAPGNFRWTHVTFAEFREDIDACAANGVAIARDGHVARYLMPKVGALNPLKWQFRGYAYHGDAKEYPHPSPNPYAGVEAVLQKLRADLPDIEDEVSRVTRQITDALDPEVLARALETFGKIRADGEITLYIAVDGEPEVVRRAIDRIPATVWDKAGISSKSGWKNEVTVTWKPRT